jgi:hypothetical protein
MQRVDKIGLMPEPAMELEGAGAADEEQSFASSLVLEEHAKMEEESAGEGEEEGAGTDKGVRKAKVEIGVINQVGGPFLLSIILGSISIQLFRRKSCEFCEI